MMPRVNDDTYYYYIGIDPGKQGGIAILQNNELINAIPMPLTDKDILEFLDVEFGMDDQKSAVIEKVGGYVAGNPAPGSAMFNFGRGYGALCMALIALEIPFEEVPPRQWQKALGISPRKKTESKTQWKNRLKQKAQQLYPNIGITLSTCDALLIATFCRRKHEGTL